MEPSQQMFQLKLLIKEKVMMIIPGVPGYYSEVRGHSLAIVIIPTAV